jgi:hypothetical protein
VHPRYPPSYTNPVRRFHVALPHGEE